MRPSILTALLALAPVAPTLALTGCASPGETKYGSVDQAVRACTGPATVPGIDVSEYQRTIDWDAASTVLSFAIARINDGHHMDPQFANNWAQIKAHGLVRGAYQFYEPTVDPGYQADVVVQAVGQLGDGDLPVTLDVEWTTGTPNAAAIQTWVDRVTAGTGKIPMIYTAGGYWNAYFSTEFGNLDLWVANWGVSCPSLPSSWTGFRFWQPGGGPVPGIAGNVDMDVFNGTLDELKAFASYGAGDHCTNGGQADCAHFGCGCVDGACNGGYCAGTGCAADHADACGHFGCGCADGACDGAYCPGTGCTPKETTDCAAYGVGCVDHACAGGFGPGSGCTARETLDCQSFGCGCVDHACGGGACPGTGCTARETLDCQNAGQACALGSCVATPPPPAGGDDGGVPVNPTDGGAPVVPGDAGVAPPNGDAGDAASPHAGHGCAATSPSSAALPLIALVLPLLRRRRQSRVSVGRA
jgi:MYXO-CTERM domain-containing protein